MLNSTNIFIAPTAGPAATLAPAAATISNTVNANYFLFDAADFDGGTYTTAYELEKMVQAMHTVVRVNTLYAAIAALIAAANPTREEANDTKQRLIYELQQLLDQTPYQRDRMAAKIAQQLFDPNVGVFSSSWAAGAVGNDVDVAQAVIDTVQKI